MPELLREPVVRWWERAGEQEGFLDSFAALAGQHAGQELPRVAAGRDFAASVLIRDPRALEWVYRHGEPEAARTANAGYETRAASAAAAGEALRLLREWRRREMLRIAWRDIAGRASVTETLHACRIWR